MKNKIFKRLYQWFTDIPKNKNRSSVIWNATGGMFNAGQAAILLVFIAHKMDLVTAGIVTIAYAVANLFLSICKYGIRNYQVTDVKEKFSFSDYLYSRYITLTGTFILLTSYLAYEYLFGGYTLEKAAIFLEVAVLKLIDAFEDVFIGRYQQVGRLDTGAKIMALRLMVSTVFICILISVGTGIHISFLGGIILSIVFDIHVIKNTFFITQTTFAKKQRNKILDLLKRCLPLCIGITLSTYIGNVPKYMIDAYMTEEIQAVFGYIMMPVFVITLLNQFIYQPMVRGLGELWKAGDVTNFKKRVLKQCLIVCGLTTVVITGGMSVGLPVLSVLYHVDLSGYLAEFAVLLLGGGLYALAYYLNVPITTIRRQNYIAYGYVAVSTLALLTGGYFVKTWGILGATVLYLVLNIILVISYSIVLGFGTKRGNSYSRRI